MPAIVTFDGPNKTIVEIAAGAVNELSVAEIYSEWKDWVRVSDNAKFLQAFSVVGGDPISPVQNLGATFFLENGWRIRPAELDHKLTLVGNLFTREAGQSVFLSTLGAFTVNTETRVSSLVDSSVARLDLTQLLQAVYVDPTNGVAGTAEGVGVPTNPVNNISDARVIADRDNLRAYYFRGSLTIGTDHTDWTFVGQSAVFNDILNVSGVSVNNGIFRGLVLTGAVVGTIECDACALEVLTGLDGTFRDCGLSQNMTIASGADVVMASCYSEVPGNSAPIITMGANSSLNLRNYSGGVEIRGMTAGCTVSIDLDPGKITLTDSSNTGGTILIRGVGRCIVSDTVRDAVAINDEGLIETHDLYIALRSLIGDADISSDDLTVSILDRDQTTVLRSLSVSADGRVRRVIS